MTVNVHPRAPDDGAAFEAALLQALHDVKSGLWGRKTTFEALPDGSIRRSELYPDGVSDRQEILTGPKWQLMAAFMHSGLSQAQRARVFGVSARTMNSWDLGRTAPSGPARQLLKLLSRHPELLAELV